MRVRENLVEVFNWWERRTGSVHTARAEVKEVVEKVNREPAKCYTSEEKRVSGDPVEQKKRRSVPIEFTDS